ncbi:MAG: nucleotidyltransferase domain-containing protein [Candidatus Dadabacteria bacterium]|nr:MAG: nucleotidyltransferase domain-containing protein [Candidatus Dadabacteria bacterium]
MEEEIKKGIKKVLDELGVSYSKIMLFGSRAKASFTGDSDWDFLIVLDERLSQREKKELWYKIYRKFHEYFPLAPVDIILKDRETFECEKHVANTISNEAYLEGAKV